MECKGWAFAEVPEQSPPGFFLSRRWMSDGVLV